MDEYSGQTECYVTPDIRNQTVATILAKEFTTRPGAPLAIVTDSGPEFCSQKFQIVIKKCDMKDIST